MTLSSRELIEPMVERISMPEENQPETKLQSPSIVGQASSTVADDDQDNLDSFDVDGIVLALCKNTKYEAIESPITNERVEEREGWLMEGMCLFVFWLFRPNHIHNKLRTS